MADINAQGNIAARCPGCSGALAMFNWGNAANQDFGVISRAAGDFTRYYRLYKCGGCGMGAHAVVEVYPRGQWPSNVDMRVLAFWPEAADALDFPDGVPKELGDEFREGETCMQAGATRAASAMFRSTLEKTLKLNGFSGNLYGMIDDAAAAGVITASRQRRAHDEVRVLGNDVLHDEWREISLGDVQAARRYTQRILEDFYDDRGSVVALLVQSGKLAPPDIPPGEES